MSINFNYGAGAQSATATNLVYNAWLYNDAIRVTADTPTQAKFTDILAPLDKPTEIKISTEPIANVYSTLANTRIPVSAQNANTSGTSVFVQLRTVVDYNKTVGTTTTNIQLPLEARLQIRVPNDAELTNVVLAKLISSLYATTCDSTGASRLGEIIRGGLVPKEI